MYIIFPCILALLILCALLMAWRKRSICKKLCCMTIPEKLCRLNELIRPLGFEYLLSQDIFTSCSDAWQREFGYCRLYDSHAALFGMVIDCEPIYFDYEGCTWMIELWKGQYGINTGAEIGIYKADSLIPRNQRTSTLFHTVPDDDLPFFEYTLYHDSSLLCRIARQHWWLTGFRMGRYSEPEDLLMKASVTFPSCEMQLAFVKGLIDCGYSPKEICICNQEVTFDFSCPHTRQPRSSHSLRAAYSQWKNRIFLKLYLHMTRHYCLTVDKLLYLYEYLPFAFRRMIRIRAFRRKGHFKKADFNGRRSSLWHKRRKRGMKHVR